VLVSLDLLATHPQVAVAPPGDLHRLEGQLLASDEAGAAEGEAEIVISLVNSLSEASLEGPMVLDTTSRLHRKPNDTNPGSTERPTEFQMFETLLSASCSRSYPPTVGLQ
jgi:hypothetical protein